MTISPDEIKQYIQVAADALGPLGKQAFMLARRQVLIDAWESTGLSIVFACIVFAGIKRGRSMISESFCNGDWQPLGLIVACLSGLLTIPLLVFIVSAIDGFANPDYQALRMLVTHMHSR